MNTENEVILTLRNDSDFEAEFSNVYTSNDLTITIKFDNVELAKFEEFLKAIITKENDNFKENQTELFNIEIKDLSIKYKLAALRYFLSNEDLVNSDVIMNIYNLVKTYNAFDDSFFEHPKVYFNNIEEYLDVRTDLMDELQAFSKQLTIYYLSILKSYYITEADTAYLNLKAIPNIYQRILYITDFFTLSKIMSKVSDINTDNLINVQNAGKYLSSLSTKLIISEDFINNLKED